MTLRRILTTDEFGDVAGLFAIRSRRVAKLLADEIGHDFRRLNIEHQLQLLAIGAKITGDIDNAF